MSQSFPGEKGAGLQAILIQYRFAVQANLTELDVWDCDQHFFLPKTDKIRLLNLKYGDQFSIRTDKVKGKVILRLHTRTT